jgi:hypothetical protein
VWACLVGRADVPANAVDVAWIRRVVPREGETNRSRWDTDPVWRVVQSAPFAPTPLAARRLVRRRQREYDVRKVDQALLGLLKRREALLHADPSGRDVSVALRDLVRPLERELVTRGEAFDAAVRRKRHAQGLPVPMVGKVLPFRSRAEPTQLAAEQEAVAELERHLGESRQSVRSASAGRGRAAEQDGQQDEYRNGHRPVQRWAWLRWKSAEVGMQQAYRALESAEMRGASERELDQLAAVFEQETAREVAARERMDRSRPESGVLPGYSM